MSILNTNNPDTYIIVYDDEYYNFIDQCKIDIHDEVYSALRDTTKLLKNPTDAYQYTQ